MPVCPALVRGLVEWIPTHADWAGYVAGPLALLGYLTGAFPVDRLLRHRDEPLEVGIRVVLTLFVVTVAWDVGTQTAPRGQLGAIGTFSNQAVGAWVSIALWTGMAAVLGHVAPPRRRRTPGGGVPPAAALLAVYAPLLFVTGGSFAAITFALSGRPRIALLAALPAIVTIAYLAWITDTQFAWGVTNGPEVGLWSAVLAVLLAFDLTRPPATPELSRSGP